MSGYVISTLLDGYRAWNDKIDQAVSWSTTKTVNLLPERCKTAVQSHCMNHAKVAMYCINLALLSQGTLALPVESAVAYSMIGAGILATSATAARLAKQLLSDSFNLPPNQRLESAMAPLLTLVAQFLLNLILDINGSLDTRKMVSVNVALLYVGLSGNLIRNGFLVHRNAIRQAQEAEKERLQIQTLKAQIELDKKCIQRFDRFVCKHPVLYNACKEKALEYGIKELDELPTEGQIELCQLEVKQCTLEHNLKARMRLILYSRDLTELWKSYLPTQADLNRLFLMLPNSDSDTQNITVPHSPFPQRNLSRLYIEEVS
ncbi:MAG: hypothetical protein H7A40_04075 [Chlamydiales bacterium]|nr:hypothetical protein [Chlamydiales bacterium]